MVKESQRAQLVAYEDSQRMEVEALQSIYLTDLAVRSSVPSLTPSSPPLPSHLELTMLPEPLQDREKANHVILSLSIAYPLVSVPLQPPRVGVVGVKGLDANLLQEVEALVRKEMERLWEEDVGRDGVLVSLCSAVQDWLRVHNVEKLSFFDEMRRREQKEAEDAERVRVAHQLQAEREERERKEKLAAEIQLINRRKERALHQQQKLETGGAHRPGAQLHAAQPVGLAVQRGVTSPTLSPLPAVAGVNRSSSEDSSKEEAVRPLPAAVGVREAKAKRAKERQSEKKQQKQQRDVARRGKRAHRGEDEEEPSTSNPVQLLADSASEDGSESGSEGDEEKKEDSDEEAVESMFLAPFPSSGGLTFFAQKKRNELDLLQELDRRNSHNAEDDEEEESNSEDSDSEADPLFPSAAPLKKPSLHSPKKAKAQLTKSPLSPSPPSPLPTSSYSRYHSDFEELQLLGRGGFGEVFKVRHRLDKLLYAVKKIRLSRRGSAVNKRILREVSTIGMLHHTFIVRYYQAWIEEEEERDPKDSAKRRDQWRLEVDEEEDWLDSSYRPSMDAADLDDDDDDGEDDEEDEDDRGSNRSSRRSSERGGSDEGGQVLFIQMEFAANRTLKDVIADRLCEKSVEACWRLFRQTLEAVAYIHSKDIVHRDVKPANIFIDTHQTVKLGDFGLAVLMGAKSAPRDPSLTFPRPPAADEGGLSAESGSLREVVGTVFYRSPEQEGEGLAYDDRADIYALGIILFELFNPFNSAMERVHVLSELRRTRHVPTDFMQWSEVVAADKKGSQRDGRQGEKEKERREERRVEREKVAAIVHQLIAEDPAQRPSAAALLKSGLIPLKLEDDYLRLSLQLLSSRDSPHHSQLLALLFQAPVDPLTDFTYDFLSAEASSLHVMRGPEGVGGALPLPLLSYHLFQQRVLDVAVHHFRLHGASLFSTPLVLPKSAHAGLEAQLHQVLLLDESGLLLKLPYTLTIPFARYVAQTAALDSDAVPSQAPDPSAWARNGLRVGRAELLSMDWRRFDVAKVYRKNPVGGRPRDMYEGDWDVVWPNPCAGAVQGSQGGKGGEARGADVEAYHREKRLSFVAEAIKLTLDIVSHFSYALGPTLIRVNHHSLVEAVMDAVLPSPTSAQAEDPQAAVYRLSSRFSLLSSPFARSAFRKQLLKTSLTERQVDWLGSCLTLRADHTQVEPALTRVRELLQSAPPASFLPAARDREDRMRAVENALAEVKALYDLLKASGVAEYVVFDLGLTGKRELYGGALTFQAFTHANTALADAVMRRTPGSPASLGMNAPVAFDPIAVGGCYDRLLAQLMPPNASTAMSGVGMNLAVEKILHAVIDCHLHTRETRTFPSFTAFFASSSLHSTGSSAAGKSKKGKRGSVTLVSSSPLFSSPSSSPPPTTFLPPTLPALASPLPSVLLFSPKQHLLRERVSLASLLWTEHFTCLFSTPLSLSLSLLFSFVRLQAVRFLVLMRRRQWKEGVVELIDMAAVTSQRRWDRVVTRLRGKDSDSREARPADDDLRERDKEGIDVVLISEMLSVLRARASNVRREDGDLGLAAQGGGVSASAASSTSATTSHPLHPHSHGGHVTGGGSTAGPSLGSSSALHIQWVDPGGAVKKELKANALTGARRVIGPMCGQGMERVAVAVAVEAPIERLRALGTAYIVGRGGKKGGGGGSEGVVEWLGGVQGKWRVALEAAWEYVEKRMSEGQCEYLFLYSIVDRKVDMIAL